MSALPVGCSCRTEREREREKEDVPHISPVAEGYVCTPSGLFM